MNSDTRYRNVAARACAVFAIFFVAPPAMAVDYQVDVGAVLNLEDIRPLIQACSNLGLLEPLRFRLNSTTDLEQLRATIESRGIAEFSGCPLLMRSVYGVRALQ